MTLRRLGKIGDREYAARRDPATDEALAFVCLTCMQDTKPARDAFERHRCKKTPPSAPPANESTPTGGEG